ncbi:Rne/Rng family ribonuclease [Nocardiopsis sp. MG754419]|uniref:Rne/Rng family ribonuclease n=1 Tax=Nocardiopsis sp. MG754419 TaxID=2259865 RepID=UPI001BAC11EF|nr:Rne/Rng family ribonuclease [Nocardiopsis sp. MG754419]MBR8740255.1 ribonuclease E/G [Nocardiopsis sp. MG754419]
MLDNEPKNGAEGTAGTTETTENTAATPPAGDGGVRVTSSAPAKGARRAAGPPPEPDDVFTPPSKPTTTLAGSGEGGTVTTSVRTTVRKRTVRAAGRPDDVPAATTRARRTRAAVKESPAEAPVTEDDKSVARAEDTSSGRDAGTEEAGTKEGSARGRTRSRSRTRATKAVEASVPAVVEEDEETEETAAEPTGAVFTPPGGMLFQPPVAQQSAPAKTRKKDRDEVVEPEADDTEDSTEEAEAPAEETGGDERPGRRRRRRGGRGRGRSRGAEDTDGEDTDTTEAAETPTRERAKDAKRSEGGSQDRDEDSAEESDDGEFGDEGERSSRRRRRRRRRSGSGSGTSGEAVTDDPPNTVVKVREPRQERPIEDEVQAVRGSTRLEAKKQRRREGREQGRRRAPIVTESEFLARREAVKRDLVIRRTGDRTQIAVLEDDILVEHYVDRATHRSYVGNVYLGRVQNVLPSMEAAFVDIGKGRNAVLYAGEVNWDSFGLEGQPKRIESVLKSGQSVLVQVTKDPIGHKGARLTSQISLPGRYLVYVPGGSMTGISRKLPDKERARLKQILKKVMPSGAGVIVRTAAEGASEEELERDITRLAKQWESIKRKSKSANAPSLLNSEPDLTVRVVRDVFNEDFSSLVVSGDEAWTTVHEYVDYVAPNLAERLSHWNEDRDVFSAYRIDEQINKALERKVWLPSGGSLIIDRTEAMTVVDVNTGKFTGQGGNLEETVTKNNLEAAEEIVRQLRLRDIGGIIVIDYIDMVLESNRDLVLRRMLECLSRDRTKHQVAEVTSLGLVQMTRKRVGQGLLEAFSHSCDHCNGRGLLLSADPVENKGGGGNGGGRKKKKGKGDAEPAAEKAVEKAEQPSGRDEQGERTDRSPETSETVEKAAEETVEQTDKPAKRSRSRKSADKADKVEATEGTEAVPAEDAGATSGESAEAAPAKKTRKRASRAKKAAETAPEAPEGVEAAPAAQESTPEAPGGVEAPEASEAPAKRTRRRTTTRKAAKADNGEGERATAEGDESDSATATPTPAEGDADGATERPKRRRTRRTKTAVASPTGGSSVDAG